MEESYIPYALALWPEEDWSFVQDNAPCHASKDTTSFLAERIPDLLLHPPASPDLNALDAGLWALWQSNLEARLAEGRHLRSDAELKALVLTAHSNISMEEVDRRALQQTEGTSRHERTKP